MVGCLVLLKGKMESDRDIKDVGDGCGYKSYTIKKKRA